MKGRGAPAASVCRQNCEKAILTRTHHLSPKSTYFDLLWICCVQQSVYSAVHMFRVSCFVIINWIICKCNRRLVTFCLSAPRTSTLTYLLTYLLGGQLWWAYVFSGSLPHLFAICTCMLFYCLANKLSVSPPLSLLQQIHNRSM